MEKNTLTTGPNITIGADPELFLVAGDVLKSSIGLVGGSKALPRPLGDREGYFVQEDNVAVEFNIPPAKTLQEFVDSITWSVAAINKEVEIYGLKSIALASALFPETELDNAAAQTFGCDPDYNAWKNGRKNPRPRISDACLRSCGGHIHVGYPKDLGIDKLQAIQLMDLYLGVPSILMDSDQQRRRLYGKAGSYRDTDYGFEYRTLSNFWLKSSTLMEWAYTQTIRAINRAIVFKGTDGSYDEFMNRTHLAKDIQKCINRGNVNASHKLSIFYDLDVR